MLNESGSAMERTYPPKELLGALTAESLQIAFASPRLRLLIDAFRVWPQGLQFEVRTIEPLDLYPDEFDVQSLDGQFTGHGLEVRAFSRTTGNGEWVHLRTSPGASETSTGRSHRRRHITIWTPTDIAAAQALKVTASWPAAGMDERSLELPGVLLSGALHRGL